MPKTCVLCRRHPASRKGEHTLPQWYLRRAFPAQLDERYTTHVDGEPTRKPDGTLRPPQESFPRTKLPVCNMECNPRLDRRFEVPAKPVVRGLWGGRLSLSPSEAFDFALWVLKTWLLTAHPEVEVSDPGWSLERWDLSSVSEDLYGWTVKDQLPPAGLSVWATRRERQARDSEPEYRIPLPTIVADGRTTKFQSFSHGMDFLDAGLLDVELVYHPGWPIEHPLEADGRAARLWPRDASSALNVGAPPLITGEQVFWYAGPRLYFEPGAFDSVARPPLSPETPEEFFPMPPGVTMVAR